jgi:hypothetical protein
MADSEGPPPTRRPGAPEPASDAKKHASKLVVLSSVAKIPPQDEADSLLGEPDPSRVQKVVRPPPLPRKPGEEGLIRPVGWTTRPGGTTTIIKLPPKTGVLPRLTSLGSKPDPAAPLPTPPTLHTAPPPLPIKVEEPADGEEETKRLPPIKLHPSTLKDPSAQESIFPSAEEKTPGTIPPPLSVAKPTGAKPPPLPFIPVSAVREEAPAARPSLGKTTTILHSKSAQLPDPRELPSPLQATTLLSPAPAPPSVIPTISSPPKTDAPTPASTFSGPVLAEPGKARKPFFVFPPASKKAAEIEPKIEPVPSSQSAQLKPIVPEPPELDRAPSLLSVTGPLREPLPAPTATPPSSYIKPAAPKADLPVAKPASVATPPKIFPGTAPTIPITPSFKGTTVLPESRKKAEPPAAVKPVVAVEENPASEEKSASQLKRAARVRKRRIIGVVGFYILLAILVPCLYFAALYFSQETRVEGQVIPPSGMVLSKEVWIVTDFRDLASGIASDLAGDRMMVMQEMQEKLGHVQRAQADVASREARIRLLKDQIQAANDEQLALVKQARDASQQVWDGPGAQLEEDYKTKLTALNQAIAERAQSLHIKYDPDPNFYSPEVWANAFRLGLYEVPAGVDSVKERLWLEGQMKGWRDFTKTMDDKQNALREQAVQLKMAPAPRIADLKTQIDDLQQRIDGTIAEEEPLKAELEQAQTDLTQVQTKEAGLDAKPYEKLYALPESNITKRLPLAANGRFSWREVEKESKYAEDEKSHAYWIFARATRSDGRQDWALHRFTIGKDQTVLLQIEPDSFISTKAILRPDLSPDEQAQ